MYFNKLDSLRTIAFFLVFWSHAFSSSFKDLSNNYYLQSIIDKLTLTGGIGVNIFFVLSGFLITYLMLQEEKVTKKFNILNFYKRRILRIWPLYYLIMIVGVFVLPLLSDMFYFDGVIIPNLIFLNNFTDFEPAHIGITWSVAIEEQFYLVWPIIFLLIKSKKKLLVFSLLIFFHSFIFKLMHPATDYAYGHTFGNTIFLMTGCIGGILFMKYEYKIKNSFVGIPNYLYFNILIIMLLIILPVFNVFFNFLSILTLPIFYLTLILNLTINSNNNSSLFSKMGKYTYGMYLYHLTILLFVKIVFDLNNLDYINNASINFIVALLALFITLATSIISYNYFERPFLKLKSRFSIFNIEK